MSSVSVPTSDVMGNDGETGSRAAVVCTHCGLDVPAALVEPNSEQQFCCHGCRTVYRVLHQHGLDQYYRLRDATGADAQPAVVTGGKYSEFDDPSFHEHYVRELPSGATTTELFVEGVHCAACAWLIERLPHLVDGVQEAKLNLRQRVVRVTWSPQRTALSRIASQLDRLGYAPHPSRAGADDAWQAEQRRNLIHIAVAGAIAGNTMLLAFALYGGMFHGMDAPFRLAFRYSSMGLAGLALLWPGRTFFASAIASLRAGRLHMDVPIAIGLTAAMIWSVAATIRDAGEVYYDCVTMLVFLLLIGRWIQARQLRASVDTVRMLFSLTPAMARRVRGGVGQQVPVEAIEVDDELEVRPGETIPVDGEILRGETAIDESLLTGESVPCNAGVGQVVRAGTMNLTSPVSIRAKATGGDTRLGRLMALVERCADSRAPIVQLADRLSGVFVITVLSLAAVTALAWWPFDPSRSIENALALLIITCPCALGLATPLAIVTGIGRAAGQGILVKGGEVLELLCTRRRLLVDKTGTLTEGRMRIAQWTGDENAITLAASLERHSTHAIAQAVVQTFGRKESTHTVGDVVQTPGSGICGIVDGHDIAIGSARYITDSGGVMPHWCADARDAYVAAGLSPVFVARDGEVVAVLGAGDTLKRDAQQAIAELQQRGWSIEIVSGDHDVIVQKVAAKLGIPAADAHGAMTPEDKLELVMQRQQHEPVVMVGDGANDAAALAAATAGIAVRGGAQASLLASDVYLSRGGLRSLIDLIDGARRTRRVIVRNLGISLGYNVIGVSLAMAGLINPILAAVLMPISSLTVVALSVRSRTFGATGDVDAESEAAR